MRLFLSCLGVDARDDELLAVTGAAASVGVVLNAIDDRPAAVREQAWEIERDELNRLGLRPVRVDLREPADLARLADLDAVWVRGGNTFVLRVAMARSGADGILASRIVDGSLAYAGYSAGPAVLSPDLTLIAGIDDPRAAGTDPVFSGLGILDRPLIPHVGMTAFDEGRRCTELHERLTADGIEHHALRDGDVLHTVDGGLRLLPRERPRTVYNRSPTAYRDNER